jgi:hypothetical protein
MTLEDRIRETLPNWPDQVRREFLLPYAEDRGWPPSLAADGTPNDEWRGLFNNRSLQRLQGLSWDLEQIQPVPDVFCMEGVKRLTLMLHGYAITPGNYFTEQLQKGQGSFEFHVSHIRQAGTPISPPAGIMEPDGLDLIDGWHRTAAYFRCKGLGLVDDSPLEVHVGRDP